MNVDVFIGGTPTHYTTVKHFFPDGILYPRFGTIESSDFLL
jgi:hypothetical protein